MSRGGITSPRRLLPGDRRAASPAIRCARPRRVPPSPHRDITLTERWMDAMGIDVAVLFPTPMLNLSNCPARRSRNRACARLQSLALRARAGARAAHQVDALSAVQRSGRLLPDGAGIRRPQRRGRLHGHVDALPQELRKSLHEDLCGAAGARPADRFSRRLQLGRPEPGADQPVHRGARARLHLVQHGAHGQLAGERDAGALPEAQDASGSRAGSPGFHS